MRSQANGVGREQLSLAYAAGAEVALWREFQTKASNHAEGELPMRPLPRLNACS